MPIPKEILAVTRPKNTVVIAYGKDKQRFAVRQRVGCKNVNGRHIPVNGPTIGHIVDGVYVPINTEAPKRVSQSPIDMKDWASVTLCDQVFKSILTELTEIYSHEDAMKIYCISILRVCDPGIKDNELKEAYETSFLSELYPGVSLSKNTVSVFLNDLGKAYSKIVRFMRNRTASVSMDHHLLVDGTLKSNESKVNSLSDFSYKAKIRGSRDISILYAFDLESMEPVCSKCFPGNMLDVTSYSEFISENRICQGILIGDKGFPSSAANEEFTSNPDLHYMNPIKRNSKLAERHNMYDFTGVLHGFEGITFRKEKCSGTDKWLYSYRDSDMAAKEERDWLRRTQKTDTYDLESLRKKQRTFGTVILECDLDLPADVAYKAYAKRWEIEIVMRYYKHACEFDETRVHDDYSVIGSELCDFLSTVLTFRLLKRFEQAELLNDKTYKKIMSILVRAKKVRIDQNEWQLIKINPSYEETLQALGLLPKPEVSTVKKVGRPKKETSGKVVAPVSGEGPRKRGRPKGSKNKPKE